MSTINLLPQDYMKRRCQRQANVVCFVLFVVVMAGVGTPALVSQRSWRHTLEVRDRVNASYEEAAKLIGQMQQLEAKKHKMLQKAELTSSLLERVPRSYLLATVTNALPKHASVQKFDLDSLKIIHRQKPKRSKEAKNTSSKFAKIKQQSAEPPPTTVVIEITGLAGTDVDVARLIANLARNPLTTSVDLVYSKEKLVDDIAVREFEIKLELKQDADVIKAIAETGYRGPWGDKAIAEADQGARS